MGEAKTQAQEMTGYMEVQKPNLFSFATSELSQDAFICWLASWAKPELKETDPLLHQTAQQFIASLILKCKREVPEINTIDVQRQDDRIDVLIVVNKEQDDRLAILIEDKTHTNHHSGQLDRYYSLVSGEKYAFREEQIIPIFFKTGYQSYFDVGRYQLYLRSDFLNVLREGKANGVANAIYDDFLAHLERLESAVNQYVQKPFNDWIATDWIGFYMNLYTELSEFRGANWNYVANPAGGFYGFWWGFVDTDQHYSAYLQLEQNKLCFKIEVPLEENRVTARAKAYDLLLEVTQNADMKFVRPARMGNGRYMTVLVMDGDYRLYSNGTLDLKNTVERLRALTYLLMNAFK
ncbi:PD-(D/E)XK nuclease family protein [Larkinella arboricola]|nr:PD-(D/E)XK nuclease family protein [Larkinella arboricola]